MREKRAARVAQGRVRPRGETLEATAVSATVAAMAKRWMLLCSEGEFFRVLKTPGIAVSTRPAIVASPSTPHGRSSTAWPGKSPARRCPATRRSIRVQFYICKNFGGIANIERTAFQPTFRRILPSGHPTHTARWPKSAPGTAFCHEIADFGLEAP